MLLEKQRLPSHVMLRGEFYRVKTDFRYGIMFHRFVAEKKPLSEYKVFFEGQPPAGFAQDVANALLAFYMPRHTLPRAIAGLGGSEETLDFTLDGDLIFAAFWQCYGVDLFATQMHWHKFLALLNGLQGTRLNEVIQIRQHTAGDNRKADDIMKLLKAAWALPQKESAPDPKLEKFLGSIKKKK